MKLRIVTLIGICCVVVAFGAEEKSARPKIVFDTVVKLSGAQKTAQLFIKNSEPVGPGAHVDIVMGDAPAHALVVDAIVQAARWKMKEPGTMPTYPADGFVTLELSQAQWDSFLYKRDLRLFVHASP
jgi:hypothetical protein